MKTTVVNVRHNSRGYDIYIGRAGHGEDGYFGNPFPLEGETDRANCLKKFKAYFYERLANDREFKRRVLELKGKRLGCFCAPRLCHGHIIAEWVDAWDAVGRLRAPTADGKMSDEEIEAEVLAARKDRK